MSAIHYVGAAFVLLLITFVGIYSGRQVKSVSDFTSGGHKAGAGIVTGTIIGTLVGGASTIGTAQLAFAYGFSAWWFTLGGGIGCFVLALVYAKPFYNSGISTLPQVFAREYGQPAATAATLLTSIGSFLSIVSQVLSGIALVTAVSSISPLIATLVTVVLMLFYVVFGGVWGAGLVGIFKTILFYLGVGGCGIMALVLRGGVGEFRLALPAGQFFNLVALGAAVDLGAGLSLVLGVLTTQAYLQAVISAKSLRTSKTGVIISAVLVPLIGVAGIFVGMYMRIHNPDINAASALPIFILEKLPPLLGGSILAALLVALVGTGAGITLGLSSMFCNDIYKVYINKNPEDGRTLTVSRMVIVVILAAAALFGTGGMDSLILGWSFMSMRLRGAVAFVPLCTALFLPGRISQKYALSAMIVSHALVLAGKFMLPTGIDSLFLGVAGSAVILATGFAAGRRR